MNKPDSDLREARHEERKARRRAARVKEIVATGRARARAARINRAKDAWNKMEHAERADFLGWIAASGTTRGMAPGRWVAGFCMIDYRDRKES